jgi:hypothetical protein
MNIEFPCGCEAERDDDTFEWTLIHMCSEHRAEARAGRRWDDEPV